MDAKEILDDLRSALDQLKAQGHRVVGIEALADYLADHNGVASEAAVDRRAVFQAQIESNLAEYRARIDYGIEQARTTIQAGQSALRTTILINGSAAVALLAFLGSLWASGGGSVPDPAHFPGAMLAFVFGVLAGAVATGCNYLTAVASSGRKRLAFHIFNSVSIVLVIASYVTFISGGILAFVSFVSG